MVETQQIYNMIAWRWITQKTHTWTTELSKRLLHYLEWVQRSLKISMLDEFVRLVFPYRSILTIHFFRLFSSVPNSIHFSFHSNSLSNITHDWLNKEKQSCCKLFNKKNIWQALQNNVKLPQLRLWWQSEPKIEKTSLFVITSKASLPINRQNSPLRNYCALHGLE